MIDSQFLRPDSHHLRRSRGGAGLRLRRRRPRGAGQAFQADRPPRRKAEPSPRHARIPRRLPPVPEGARRRSRRQRAGVHQRLADEDRRRHRSSTTMPPSTRPTPCSSMRMADGTTPQSRETASRSSTPSPPEVLGLGFAHYGVEVPAGAPGEAMHRWIGGFYEITSPSIRCGRRRSTSSRCIRSRAA